jgi:hypothetical protein
MDGDGLWLGAPIMHWMYGCSLKWHWHVGWVHVHFSTHFGIVESGGVLLWYPTLGRVKHLVIYFQSL